MNSRRRLLILGAILMALAVLMFFLIGEPGKKERSYSPITRNLQNPWLHDEDVYYYTGSFFAKYDTGANKIEQLSDYVFIKDGIGSVDWTPEAVVFQATPAPSTRDDLTTAAVQLGAKPSQTHWWKYNFQADRYELLALPDIDSCTSLIQAGSSQLVCLSAQSSTEGSLALKVYDLETGDSKTAYSTDDDIEDITSDGKSVYFVVTNLSGGQALHSANLSSLDDKTLFSSKDQLNFYVYDDGQILINESPNKDPEEIHAGETPQVTKQKLVLLKGGEEITDKGVRSLPLTLFSNSRGDMLFSSLDGSVKQVVGGAIKTLYKSADPALENSDFLFTANQKLYLISASGELSSTPAVPREGKFPTAFNTKDDNDKSGNSFIDMYSDGKQDVFLYLPNVSVAQQQAAVGRLLEQRGFKPSEFNFNWVVDGADFHAPVTPNAVIVK